MIRLEKLSNEIAKRHYDYIIVGAGMGGLYSAQILAENGITNFLILQAQQGVGGRVETVRLGEITETNKSKWIRNNTFLSNFAIEKGATWIQESHFLLLHLASTLGISLRKQYRDGVSTLLGKDWSMTTQQVLATPSLAKPLLEFISKLLNLGDEYSKHVITQNTIDEKYKEMVLKYDNMTVNQYIQSEVQNQLVQQIVHGFLQHIECLSLYEDSMHEMLLRTSRSADIETITEWLRLQEEASFIVNGGTEVFLEKFQVEIEKKTGLKRSQLIRFEEEVVAIDNTVPEKIKIKVNKNGNIIEYTCKRPIINVPIGVLNKISIAKLSPAKQIIFDNQTRNLVKKSFIITRRPFWKDKCTGDGLYSHDHHISMSHDVSPLNNECGILVFFHCGDKYTKWHEQFPLNMPNRPQNLKKYFRHILAKMYLNGNEESPEIQDLIYIDFNMIDNRFVNSAFQSNCKAGTLTALLKSGEVFQRYYNDENGLTFVGSEFSDDYNSYMEGAVRAASKKIHHLLNKPDPFMQMQKQIKAEKALQETIKKD